MSLEWFEFHPKPFITDTMRLSTEAKGAYLLLMLDYYETEGPAPDDDEVLAAITGLPIETWRRHRRVIEPLFQVSGGLWHHATCAQVIEDAHARIAKASAKGKDAAAKRWNGKARGNAAGNAPGKPQAMPPVSPGHTTGNAHAEADFGPSMPRALPTAIPQAMPTASEMPRAYHGHSPEHATGNASGMHLSQLPVEREGANAPSSASGLSIGSLLDPEFTPESSVIASAIHDDGVSAEELSGWLDDWKSRCINDGTRLSNWHAAWDREYDRRVKLRAKARPKPRVSVSRPPKKPKAEGRPMPANWQLSAGLIEFAHKHHVDPHFIEQELRAYCSNPAGMYRYSDHDAAFRTFVLKRANNHGQAQPTRRAPPPRGSIVNAVEELDADLARRGAGGAPAQDQPDGRPAVQRLPQD